jgi:hypothetical protein
MRFDSKVDTLCVAWHSVSNLPPQLVIPTQFVLFNLSAIVGSAILYGDFRKATFHQMVTFLYGCAATFVGVFILAWSPPGEGDDDDDDAGEEEEPVAALSPTREPFGSVGRHSRRLALAHPGSIPIQRMRRRQSVVGLMGGISPAQVSGVYPSCVLPCI